MVLKDHREPKQLESRLAPLGRCLVNSVAPTSRHNLAIPRRGHVLTSVSEAYGRSVRDAVAELCGALQTEDCARVYHHWLARRVPEPGAWVVRPPEELLAWSLVSAWITGFAAGKITSGAGVEEAAIWFFGGVPDRNPIALVPKHVLTRANNALDCCRDSTAYLELLPYVLDPHGPGSRLSVRRDAATRRARDRKRTEGIYYTPVDVADYMMCECLRGLGDAVSSSIIFDPACGTGVFLRAALKALKAALPDQTIRCLAETLVYGTDVDPWALDAAAFVLLADCLVDHQEHNVSPLLLWHRLRLNLCCVDALAVDPAEPEEPTSFEFQANIFSSLASGRLPPQMVATQFDNRIPLARLFGRWPDGRLVVVGNPPYASLGHRGDISELQAVFSTIGNKPGPNSEIYPLFVEQMVRLGAQQSATGTLVLPLSLASNIGNQFVEVRSLIENTPGTWRFAFFDRQPHALFGEDVKTRNNILFWHRGEDEREIEIKSGPLRKWRGDGRAFMFASIQFTPIVGPIRSGIPKIDGVCQARAHELLARRRDRFDHACTSIRRMPLANVLKNDRHTVFVGATAYNFLNVFLSPPPGALANTSALSEHPLHAMEFSTKEEATAAFALLSSRLAFWWWHVTHDGFHVTWRFLAGIPFGLDALSGVPRETLASCGERLWSLIRSSPTVSRNRGRSSLAFSPNGFDEERCEIDRILADLAGLEPDFVIELQRFTAHTIRAEVRTVHNT